MDNNRSLLILAIMLSIGWSAQADFYCNDRTSSTNRVADQPKGIVKGDHVTCYYTEVGGRLKCVYHKESKKLIEKLSDQHEHCAKTISGH